MLITDDKNNYFCKANTHKAFMTRKESFKYIRDNILCKYYDDDNSVIAKGDSLSVLESLPDSSVSLILTDPPYHSTKKSNIVNDTSFKTDEEFIGWIESFAKQWKRILKPNGSIFMFCSSTMEARLELMLSKYFNVLSHIVWTKPNDPGYDGWKGKMKKEALRKWYPFSERIIFCEQCADPDTNTTCFSKLLKSWRKTCGIPCNVLTEKIGAFGKVNHGGAVSNWEAGRNIPSLDQYNKICAALAEYDKGIEFPDYRDIIRPFEVNADVRFTDVWDFPSVRQYRGKHPAEKPIDMLEHCIKSTTYEEDIVVDCFAGSGSSLIASIKNNRYCIGIEIDEQWCSTMKNRIAMYNEVRHSVTNDYAFMKESSAASHKTLTLL